MITNIKLGPGSYIRNCLIIRLDDSEYVVSIPEDEEDFFVETSIIYPFVPSLWGWVKLWWRHLRQLRRQPQPPIKAAIICPEKLAVLR